MNKRILIGSIIAVAIILLSSFSSVVGKISSDDELVEIDVEFCGLDASNKIYLTLEEAKELNELIDNFEKQLSSVRNEDEAYEIYTQMLSTLEDYQIINSIQKKRLIFTIQHSIKIGHVLSSILGGKKSKSILAEEDYSNIFCLTIFRTENEIFRWGIGLDMLIFLNDIAQCNSPRLYDLSLALIFLLQNFPTSFFRNRDIYGDYDNKDTKILTIGLLGIKHDVNQENIRLIRFTGLILTLSIDFEGSPFPITDNLAIGWTLIVKDAYRD